MLENILAFVVLPSISLCLFVLLLIGTKKLLRYLNKKIISPSKKENICAWAMSFCLCVVFLSIVYSFSTTQPESSVTDSKYRWPERLNTSFYDRVVWRILAENEDALYHLKLASFVFLRCQAEQEKPKLQQNVKRCDTATKALYVSENKATKAIIFSDAVINKLQEASSTQGEIPTEDIRQHIAILKNQIRELEHNSSIRHLMKDLYPEKYSALKEGEAKQSAMIFD